MDLIPKKVESMLLTKGIQGYSGMLGSTSWITGLSRPVFFNLKGTSRKALHGILWVLEAT